MCELSAQIVCIVSRDRGNEDEEDEDEDEEGTEESS